MKRAFHIAAVQGEQGNWHSLPPHIPGKCRNRDTTCPSAPDEPCWHKHHSSRTALACSQNREPFDYLDEESDHE